MPTDPVLEKFKNKPRWIKLEQTPMSMFLCAAFLSLLVGSSIAQATNNALSSSESACQLLTKALGAKVQSAGAQYNASATGAWSLFNQLDGREISLLLFWLTVANNVSFRAYMYCVSSQYFGCDRRNESDIQVRLSLCSARWGS